jgi:hypothetical protein
MKAERVKWNCVLLSEQNSRELNGWAAGGELRECAEGAGKCCGLETSKQTKSKTSKQTKAE